MSENKFDKHIKSKLESVQPVFEEAAWKRLRTSLPLPWYKLWWQQWGGWLVGGASSLLFLGTLYTIYTQHRENRRLYDEISTLKQQPQATTKTDTVFVETTRIDTLYVVKVVKEREVVRVPVAAATEVPEGSARPTELSGQADGRRPAKTSHAPASAGSSNKSEGDNTRQLADATPAAGNTTEQTTGIQVPESKFQPMPPAYQPEENVIREKPENEKTKVEEVNKVPEGELLVAQPKPQPEPEKKKFKLPYIHTRLGVTSDIIGMRIFSLGPSIEAFVRHNLSIQTGLLLAQPQEVRHGKPADFNRFTGKRFEDEFDLNLPGQTRIDEIVVSTSFVKLPIALTYYLPSRSNFTFFATAGTNLDLSVYQEVEFKAKRPGSYEEEYDKFERRPKPKTFNGLFYGMGMQYEYRRLRLQFSPYFDFRFRKDEWLPPARNFGVRGSLLYDFGK